MEILKQDDAGRIDHFSMRKPFDMHQHMRDGSLLKFVGPMIARRFAGAIVMPNLKPPITTIRQVETYMSKIRQATNASFRPLMTFYFTDALDPCEVEAALRQDRIVGVKYYPRGLTTNSDDGVKNPAALWTRGTKPYEVLKTIAENDGVLLLHAADGFDTDGIELDPFDQEPHFIRHSLPRIREAHPELVISLEHLSTKDGADYIRAHGGRRLGCSLTPHHLLLDRRDLFRGGFNPHRSWMPIIQSHAHRNDLRALASERHSCVWLGSDSAPHPKSKKEAACCASGVLTAHIGIELYAEVFDTMGILDFEHFEHFASLNGPAFYGIPPSRDSIEIVRRDWKVQDLFFADDGNDKDTVYPFRLHEDMHWRIV
jgi:dihydroorotase